jgi:hypothetical protein
MNTCADSARDASRRKLVTAGAVLMLVALWLLMRGYHGLTGDGQIYAFQALARIHPTLATDLYLQYGSQDQYTIFSPFYAWVIGLCGLEHAARLLTVLFTAWFLVAAWALASAITSRFTAWLAVASLIVLPGNYGAAGVFSFSEQFLSARLPAEALVVTALVCHFRGMKKLSLWVAAGALFVHPLIALPGLLLLICLGLPARTSVAGVFAGVFVVLGIAAAARTLPAVEHVIPLMDAAWLEVVRERSQFLFLQLWSTHDWDLNARPFVCLALTMMAHRDGSPRKFSVAVALIGGAGMAIALIASLVGPVAILLQGQAWRWVWLAAFVSVLLLPFTSVKLWNDEKCGPLCVILLISGWIVSPVAGTACVSLALICWMLRSHISDGLAPYFRWLAVALAFAILAWTLRSSWTLVASTSSETVRVSSSLAVITRIFALKVPAALFALALWWGLLTSRTRWIPALVSVLLFACSAFISPSSFKQPRSLGSASDIKEFSDWTNAIPPTRTVLVAPAQDVGGFVWFTLERPNYLAVDQSAGVVFSRATAHEIRRRSEVLLPLMDPNWKILTSLPRAGNKRPDKAVTRALTTRSLIQICTDPQLGFVIAPQNVGFGPLRHEHAGAWKDWNLYDCEKVRSLPPT